MSSSFGKLLTVTTWGESHGESIGVIIDGCPSGISISEEEIQEDLNRRKPGQSKITTQRKEADKCEIQSGIFEGKTLGTPIALLIKNQDSRPEAYEEMKDKYRPSHADFCYSQKYQIRDWRGGGRASARTTVAQVAAGAIAKKILSHFEPNLEILAWVNTVGKIQAQIDSEKITREIIETEIVRCPDTLSAKKMIDAIEEARKNGDSLGGTIRCIVKNPPIGLGEPLFEKLEALLGKAMLSIPATKGFEIGSGFSGTEMFGSEHNDLFYLDDTQSVRTKSNHSGGIQGGISNGETIDFKIAFKPTATIAKEQETVDEQNQSTTIIGKGRHDPCVLPRAVPIVEAMTALVLCDCLLMDKGRKRKES